MIKNKEKITTEIKNNSENNGPINSNNGKQTIPYPKKRNRGFIFKFIYNTTYRLLFI